MSAMSDYTPLWSNNYTDPVDTATPPVETPTERDSGLGMPTWLWWLLLPVWFVLAPIQSLWDDVVHNEPTPNTTNNPTLWRP